MTNDITASANAECHHCRGGWFPNQRFGADVECVNGILIDIDKAHEGWGDEIFPVAPRHPMWQRQCKGDESFYNDSHERLTAWASSAIADGSPKGGDGEAGSVHDSAVAKPIAQSGDQS